MKTHQVVLASAVFALAGVAPVFADDPIDTQRLTAVHFAFDSADVTAIRAFALAGVATWSAQHPHATIVLDGHTDPVGPTTYNVVLGMRRAERVKAKLVELGVDPKRLVIVTYGEDGVQHTSHRLDREVAIWGTEQPLRAIVDRSLLRGTAIAWSEPVTATALAPIPRAEQIGAR